ncbi:MAG: hypothetical protein LBQ57_07645, partial [Spirochaetales bacterium]|nr:hypothetical protein [Spirochaetales bacterium]
QKTGLSASIFWLCQKDLRCNPWRDPGASGDFARKKLVHPPGKRMAKPGACKTKRRGNRFAIALLFTSFGDNREVHWWLSPQFPAPPSRPDGREGGYLFFLNPVYYTYKYRYEMAVYLSYSFYSVGLLGGGYSRRGSAFGNSACRRAARR